jgi:hypothetical protein
MSVKRKRRRKKALRLGRLRKSVAVNNRIYGLLVQALDSLRWTVDLDHEKRLMELEKRAGLTWSHTEREYVP